jgi:hypothetical protein
MTGTAAEGESDRICGVMLSGEKFAILWSMLSSGNAEAINAAAREVTAGWVNA